MISFDVNILCVCILAVSHYILGALWYSPLLFAKQWLKLLGINKNDIKELKYPVALSYIITLIFSFVFVYFFALILYNLKIYNILFSIIVSLLLYFGFNFFPSLKNVLWEAKPFKLFLIDTSYDFISYIIIGIVLTVWK